MTQARLLLDEAWLAWKNDQTLEMEAALGGLELARKAGTSRSCSQRSTP